MSKGGNEQTKNKIISNAKKFKPVEGLSYGQLKFGYWWLEHRVLLKKIFYGIIGAVGAVLLGYGIYGFSVYIFKGIDEDYLLAQQIAAAPVVSHEYIKSIGAQELILGNINVISGNGNTYDFAVEVNNPNEKWQAELDYYFVVDQKSLETRHDFILPNEKKYLTEFLYESSGRPSGVELKISNLKWQRIKSRDVVNGNIEQFIEDGTDIEVSDAKIITGRQSGLSDKTQISKVVFTAKNNTPYNFWEVDFYLALKSGGRLIGINKYQASQLLSGETRKVELIWPGRISGSLEVIPSVNVFDEDNYMEFELGAGQLK